MTHRKYRSFTLLELIAVITIVALITGLVSQRIGHTPAFLTIEDYVSRIDRLSQIASKRSIMQGKNLGIFFQEEERALFIGTSLENQVSERDSKIELPEELELSYEDMDSEEPLFSFFPDGTGDGAYIELKFKAHERVITISPLTGILSSYEPER